MNENVSTGKQPSESEREAFLLSVDETEREYETSLKKGLTSEQVKEKTARYGKNQLQVAKRRSIMQMFISQFTDVLILVLLVAAVISGFLGEVSDAVLIIIIVIINAVIGVVQERKAEDSMEALKKMVVPEAKVMRDGQQMIIQSVDLVPGDVVYLDAGDYVPADGRLVEAANLQIQEAALTGESTAVHKNTENLTNGKTPLGDRDNFVFSTTIVTNGRGRFIVTKTGMDSEIGRIAGMIQTAPATKTPLQIRLNELGKTLAIGCLAACAIIFVVGLIRGGNPLELFMTAVSLAVAAIPEGLPAIVTVVLAMGTTRLVKQNAIIRKLPAVETLGSASVICSDKTGTLTQNKMTIKRIFAEQEDGIIDADEILENGFTPAEKVVVFGGLLCNDASIVTDENGVVKIGDPTEIAMIDYADRVGYSKNELLEQMPRVEEIPFDSDRKLMTTVHKLEDKFVSLTKGAPDVLISRCTSVLRGQDGIPKEFGEEAKKNVLAVNDELSDQAYRVIGYGVKIFDELPSADYEVLEQGLTFGGLSGMIDPPRLEVKDSIAECRSAGIKTVMITGDHVNTAKAIARDLNIYEDGDLALTGVEIDEMDDKTLSDNIEKIKVCARVSPENKVRIVDTWQKKNAVVAMTGDGVNDAPALKKADIGCAMGITGTEVSKEASEMILTDDNFATIVSAVREGRGIYENIRKAVHFLLSTNIAEILTLFIATLVDWPQPLLPVHILWINLITDSFPALALGVEKTDPDIMNNPPRHPDESIFAGGLGSRIIIQGIMIAAISLFTFWYADKTWGISTAQTMTFTVLAMCQLTHAINAKMGKHSIFDFKLLFTNRFFWGAILLSACLQISVDLIPALHPIFDTVDLSGAQWEFIGIAILLPLVFVEIGKLIMRLFSGKKENKS
ncbi:MAG: calcium-translocating P-type ATPase, PMCA-type [Eubacteriaceae bacterium]|jgi:Ca2+-transporting ATPase